MYDFWLKTVFVNCKLLLYQKHLIVNVTRVCIFQLNQLYSVKLNKELDNNVSIFCYNKQE